MFISNIQNSIIQLLPVSKLREGIGRSQGLIACMPKTGSTFLKKIVLLRKCKVSKF